MNRPNNVQSTAGILLADTNAVYKLYFFFKKGLLPPNNIFIPNIGSLEFHPIVLDEVAGHINFRNLILTKEYDYLIDEIPKFFSHLLDDDFPNLLMFTKNNLCKSLEIVDLNSEQFQKKRKIYEVERVRLQKMWIANNEKGKRVHSRPGSNDYSLLFSAEKHGYKIVTHDGILSAIAFEILNDEMTMKVEDIIKQILLNEPSQKEKIEAILANLDFVGESLNSARIFSK